MLVLGVGVATLTVGRGVDTEAGAGAPVVAVVVQHLITNINFIGNVRFVVDGLTRGWACVTVSICYV